MAVIMDDNGDPYQAASDICSRVSKLYEVDPAFCENEDFLPPDSSTTSTSDLTQTPSSVSAPVTSSSISPATFITGLTGSTYSSVSASVTSSSRIFSSSEDILLSMNIKDLTNSLAIN